MTLPAPDPDETKYDHGEKKKGEKTSQSTLLHGGDVGMCGGSWGYVRETENNFYWEVAIEVLSSLGNLIVVKKSS